ncbi:hypothetical protein WJX84_011298 [Apatococcus fuscideae]|uniref:Uncharacterized protein n=1 Tax=Apatococcus fuscideae TaxID=2026836 RepID=A0AAW1TF46_9CHLO
MDLYFQILSSIADSKTVQCRLFCLRHFRARMQKLYPDRCPRRVRSLFSAVSRRVWSTKNDAHPPWATTSCQQIGAVLLKGPS